MTSLLVSTFAVLFILCHCEQKTVDFEVAGVVYCQYDKEFSWVASLYWHVEGKPKTLLDSKKGSGSEQMQFFKLKGTVSGDPPNPQWLATEVNNTCRDNDSRYKMYEFGVPLHGKQIYSFSAHNIPYDMHGWATAMAGV
ncbi:hypothetical protein CRE_02397 [Caenorhabditis remanei]|uniref:Uncharacterized protein n=1 Tax=Caenorhabditis remanei TaxID=31234 RepID=E3MIL3_CAERE|nr:hypothetical protein CRE_02397 [Caenorhabditis remanei]